MSAFCGCLKSSPHLDNSIVNTAQSRQSKKKGIHKSANDMDMMLLQK